MNRVNSYFFRNKTDAAKYLYDRLENKTSIKIQIGLYLLWAYYAGSYGSIDYDDADFQTSES